MTADQMYRREAFDRSRAHRRGVRQACSDLGQALGRPADQHPEQWWAEAAAHLQQLAAAFQHHVEQSEGPDGLLREIVEVAPRLVHAVERVKHEHEVLLAEIARLEAAARHNGAAGELATVLEEARRLLQDIDGHGEQGAELIYEAYSVDVEGGESG
jgi:hypothetical protein